MARMRSPIRNIANETYQGGENSIDTPRLNPIQEDVTPKEIVRYKRCSTCKRDIPINEFYNSKNSTDGKAQACIYCTKKAITESRNRLDTQRKLKREEQEAELMELLSKVPKAKPANERLRDKRKAPKKPKKYVTPWYAEKKRKESKD